MRAQSEAGPEEEQAELAVFKEFQDGAERVSGGSLQGERGNPGVKGARGKRAWKESSGDSTAKEQGDSWEKRLEDEGAGGRQAEVAGRCGGLT